MRLTNIILAVLSTATMTTAAPSTSPAPLDARLAFVDPGGPCQKASNCYGGANCCSGICKLGSCRMDGSCDADNDCYGWCHNDAQGPSVCCVRKGKSEGTCNCSGTCGSPCSL